jgi:hypothetical protein
VCVCGRGGKREVYIGGITRDAWLSVLSLSLSIYIYLSFSLSHFYMKGTKPLFSKSWKEGDKREPV